MEYCVEAMCIHTVTMSLRQSNGTKEGIDAPALSDCSVSFEKQG